MEMGALGGEDALKLVLGDVRRRLDDLKQRLRELAEEASVTRWVVRRLLPW